MTHSISLWLVDALYVKCNTMNKRDMVTKSIWWSSNMDLESCFGNQYPLLDVHMTLVEVMWIQILLWKIGIQCPLTAKLWCDNLDTKYLLANS